MPADIRTARASDADDLAAIENAVFEADRISPRSFRRLIVRDTAAVLVADGDKALAGYCVVLFRSASAAARLYSIAVAPGVAGIGRSLLEAAERAASLHGKNRLRLEVREDNFRAIGLYEKSGYGRIGEIPGYYADGVTALRYEKPLSRKPRAMGLHDAGTAAA